MRKDDSCPRCHSKVVSNALECPKCGVKLRIIDESSGRGILEGAI